MVDDEPLFQLTMLLESVEEALEILEAIYVLLKFLHTVALRILIVVHRIHYKIVISQRITLVHIV